MFSRSRNTKEPAWMLCVIGVSGKSKITACSRTWIWNDVYLGLYTWWNEIPMAVPMSIAVVYSLLSCLQAKIYVICYLLPVIRCHLWFTSSPDVPQFEAGSVMFPHLSIWVWPVEVRCYHVFVYKPRYNIISYLRVVIGGHLWFLGYSEVRQFCTCLSLFCLSPKTLVAILISLLSGVSAKIYCGIWAAILNQNFWLPLASDCISITYVEC